MFVIYYLERNEKRLTLGRQDSEETDVRRASSRTSSTQQQHFNAGGKSLQSQKKDGNSSGVVPVLLVALLVVVLVVALFLGLGVLGLLALGGRLGGGLLGGGGLGLLGLGDEGALGEGLEGLVAPLGRGLELDDGGVQVDRNQVPAVLALVRLPGDADAGLVDEQLVGLFVPALGHAAGHDSLLPREVGIITVSEPGASRKTTRNSGRGPYFRCQENFFRWGGSSFRGRAASSGGEISGRSSDESLPAAAGFSS